MIKGCQTHFGALVGAEVLVQLKGKGCQACRIDTQSSSIPDMLGMVEEVWAAEMIPYVTVANYEHIEALPSYARCEWRNEPDIATNEYVPPAQYRDELWEAALVAGRNSVGQIGGLVISNLNKRGVNYVKAVGRLPENVFGVCHRYGDGTFSQPHYLNWYGWLGIGPFQSREAELRWFKSVAGPRIVVSEWGYPSREMGESQQALFSRQEWDLHDQEGVEMSFIYQLNDGLGEDESFGLRRVNGEWKPVSETF